MIICIQLVTQSCSFFWNLISSSFFSIPTALLSALSPSPRPPSSPQPSHSSSISLDSTLSVYCQKTFLRRTSLLFLWWRVYNSFPSLLLQDRIPYLGFFLHTVDSMQQPNWLPTSPLASQAQMGRQRLKCWCSMWEVKSMATEKRRMQREGGDVTSQRKAWNADSVLNELEELMGISWGAWKGSECQAYPSREEELGPPAGPGREKQEEFSVSLICLLFLMSQNSYWIRKRSMPLPPWPWAQDVSSVHDWLPRFWKMSWWNKMEWAAEGQTPLVL